MDSDNSIKTSREVTEIASCSEQPAAVIEPPPSRTMTRITSLDQNVSQNEKSIDPGKHDKSERTYSFQDSPILDVFAVFCSAGILLAIVGVLQHYDGKKQPDWKHLSLNTAIAWLTTISKGCIVLLITRSIGQLKWVWFASRKQRVSDLRTFDMASRGILGSTILLFKQKGRHLASIGCIAIILSFAFEPFVQNLVRYVPVSVEDPFQVAHLANTSVYKTKGPLQGAALYYVDPMMKANVYSAMLNLAPIETWAIPQYNCASGNCTWGPIDVLAADYSCINVTSDLTIYCNRSDIKNSFTGLGTDCEVSVPGGPQLRFSTYSQFGTIFTMATRLRIPARVSKGDIYPLLRTHSIRATNVDLYHGGLELHLSNSTRWAARECVLYPSVKKVSATVRNGEYNEITHNITNPRTDHSIKVWSEWQNFAVKSTLVPSTVRHEFGGPDSGDSFYVGLQPPPWPNDSNIRDRKTLGLSWTAANAVSVFFASLLHGSVAASGDELGFYAGRDRYSKYLSPASSGATQDILRAILFGNIAGCSSSRDPLDCAMENIAKAVTKTFRDAAYVQHGYEQANMTVGQTLVQQVYVNIQWAWLILPVLTWALAVALWFATIWRTWTSDIPIWRNNPLPLLFLYRPSDENSLQRNADISSLGYTRRTKRVFGQLHAKRGVSDPRLE